MGFFDSFIGGSFSTPFDPAGFSTGGGFGQGTDFGQAVSVVGDPLDIFGSRAEFAASENARIQAEAAAAALSAQQNQLDAISGLFDPFADAGAQPLSELVGAFTGDQPLEFTPSEGFNAAVDQGTRGVRRGAAARGGLDSSGTEARLADLVNALTGQEVQSQIEQRLQPIRTAQQAEGIIGAQATDVAGAGSAVFGNLANQQIQNAANLGDARQSSLGSLSSGLSGLANLAATQPITSAEIPETRI